MLTCIALLRGINVGGNNIIKMADLKDCLQDDGFNIVQTYIQSGNVVLQAEEKNSDALLHQLQSSLRNTFDFHNPVVLLRFTHRKLGDDPTILISFGAGWHTHLGILADRLAGNPPK